MPVYPQIRIPIREVQALWGEVSCIYLGMIGERVQSAAVMEHYAKQQRPQALEVGRTLLVNLFQLRVQLGDAGEERAEV